MIQKLSLQLIILMAAILVPLTCTAAGGNRLVAQVEINPDLKPQYAVSITPTNAKEAPWAAINIILQLIVGSLIYAAGPVAVLMLAIGGVRYVISHGDQNQMEEAKKTIKWAIIGLLVIMVSYLIVQNVINILSATPG